MKTRTARKIRCVVCDADLSAQQQKVNAFGRETTALRAPPRITLTIGMSGTPWPTGVETKHKVSECAICATCLGDVIERLPDAMGHGAGLSGGPVVGSSSGLTTLRATRIALAHVLSIISAGLLIAGDPNAEEEEDKA